MVLFINTVTYRERHVRTFIDSDLYPGFNRVTWNGRDESGKTVFPGISLFTLRAGEGKFIRKMTILNFAHMTGHPSDLPLYLRTLR